MYVDTFYYRPYMKMTFITSLSETILYKCCKIPDVLFFYGAIKTDLYQTIFSNLNKLKKRRGMKKKRKKKERKKEKRGQLGVQNKFIT